MLTLIKSPFIDYKLTILRNKKTSNSLFRQTMNEISYLIAAEVLKHLKYKLHIENIEIVRSQVIEYKPTLPFDTLICRAFAPLDRMIIETEHLINNSSQLLAMKGESIDREIKLLQSHNFQTQIIDLSHPDLASQPKLVRIKSLN